MASCALLVWRAGATQSASAATMKRIATPVAPHLNFSRRAMRVYPIHRQPVRQLSEGRRRDHPTPRDTHDGEGPVERRYDLIVLVKWRIRDIHHVAGLHAELLGYEDRHRLPQVQPKNTAPGAGIVLDISHPEYEHAGLVGPLIGQATDLAQGFEQRHARL